MIDNKNILPTPRAARINARQSVLISGMPDILYQVKERKQTVMTVGNKEMNLGQLSDDAHLALDDLAKNSNIVKIKRVTKNNKVPVNKLDGFPGINIRKYYKDTMVVIHDKDEESLLKQVSRFKTKLENEDIKFQERCNWMCVGDKGKLDIPNDEILKKEKIIKEHKEMSEKTKSLRDIAIKSIKENEGKT